MIPRSPMNHQVGRNRRGRLDETIVASVEGGELSDCPGCCYRDPDTRRHRPCPGGTRFRTEGWTVSGTWSRTGEVDREGRTGYGRGSGSGSRFTGRISSTGMPDNSPPTSSTSPPRRTASRRQDGRYPGRTRL